MANVVPVDAYSTGEWYPGYKPEFFDMPWIVDPAGPFKPGDENQFWFLDFHWSRGLTPLGATLWSGDGYCWGTQHAAESLPLPPGRGVSARFAGTHLYGSALPETDPREIEARAGRIATNLPHFLQNYRHIWESGRDELENTWSYFRGVDFTKARGDELPDLLVKGRRYHKRSMEIHFGVMYPMLANFLGFYGACADMGIDPNEIGKFLQGEDTKIMETDRLLYGLAMKARAAGLEPVFEAHSGSQLRAALGRHGGAASVWLTEFDAFLQTYGWRAEATCDVGVPSWIEDNTIPLDLVKTFLQRRDAHDFEAAARNALAEREEAIENARAGLTREEQAVFDAGLASNQEANFPWWQDDHNYYIDLKVMLPLRWGCQELAQRVKADRHDDMLYLFWPELMDVATGEKPYDAGLRSLVDARRQYFDQWHDRRGEMPKVLGTIPEAVEDPILIEIFGLNPQSIRAVQNPDAAQQTTISGVAAAKGVARGIARVLQSSDELHRLDPGVRVDVPELDPGVRQDRRCGLRRRWNALPRRDRRPGVRRPHGHRDRGGDAVDPRRRRGRGRRQQRHRHDPGAGRRGRGPGRGGGHRVTVEVMAVDVERHSCEAIAWLDEVDPAEAVACGGAKMGRLAELLASGVQVPQGFAVTVEAYRRHCADSGLDARIDAVLAGLGSDPDDGAVEAASAAIRELFVTTPVSEALTARLTEAYEELCLRCVDVNVPVAVRSSATGEDAADASFAGIFDTYLGVSGIERVVDSVRRCWGSLFTARALAYRLRRGISHHEMPIAVGVIELIHARASGVAFSVHPVTGKRDRIVVETSWGWGEAIVQGLVDPDHVEIGKADGRVLRYDVAHKKVVSAFDFACGAVTEIEMPAKLADRRVLDDEQIGAIAAAVTAIEEHYGHPVDVEWVISRHRRAGDPVCIVQTRPVTTVEPEPTAAPAYDPVALAQKYLFSGKPIPGR